MSTPDYSFYSRAELIELLEDRDHTLSYQQDTINMLKKENLILKKELYNLVPRVERVERFKQEIENILNSSKKCSVKVTNINNALMEVL